MNIVRLRDLANNNPIIKAALYPGIIVRRLVLYKKKSWQYELIFNIREMSPGDVVLKIKEFHGVFTIDPHSSIFSRLRIDGCYEPQLVKLCMK